MLGPAQITQWDFQNKGKPSWTGKSSFVLEVPIRYLRPSIIYSVPYDRVVQRACWVRNIRNISTVIIKRQDRVIKLRSYARIVFKPPCVLPRGNIGL